MVTTKVREAAWLAAGYSVHDDAIEAAVSAYRTFSTPELEQRLSAHVGAYAASKRPDLERLIVMMTVALAARKAAADHAVARIDALSYEDKVRVLKNVACSLIVYGSSGETAAESLRQELWPEEFEDEEE